MGLSPLFTEIASCLESVRVPFKVVANKADKVGKSRHASRHQAVAQALGRTVGDVSWVSAEKGTGVAELRKLVQAILEQP